MLDLELQARLDETSNQSSNEINFIVTWLLASMTARWWPFKAGLEENLECGLSFGLELELNSDCWGFSSGFPVTTGVCVGGGTGVVVKIKFRVYENVFVLMHVICLF